MLCSVQPWKSGREQHTGSLPSCQQHSSLQLCIWINSEALIPVGNGSQRNDFYCLSLGHFVKSICWELFSKQDLYLKWHSEFWFVTKVAVNLLRTGNELLWHGALLWTATPELPWRARPVAEVGSWFLISPGHSAHCCVRMHLGNGEQREQVWHSSVLPGERLPENVLISSRIHNTYKCSPSLEVSCYFTKESPASIIAYA